MVFSEALSGLLSGALAGSLTKTLLAPLDRLKLVVQLQKSLVEESSQESYRGPIKAVKKIIREEGFFSLWRGNSSTILIQGGTSALNFMFMDVYKKAALELAGDQNRLANSFISGGLAGATAITLLYPVGLARTKLALDVGSENRRYPRGMRDVFKKSTQANGFRSLYQGYGIALWSVSLYRMVYLGGYDYLKLYVSTGEDQSDNHHVPVASRFMIAQTVSMAAATVHYPLDSVRRRLMMQSDLSEKQYLGAVDCFKKIYQREGIRGFFLGLGTNYIRSVGAALVLVSYDAFRELFR